jgi:hypothetical protein
MSSLQRNYENFLLAFPFFIEIWFDDSFSTWSPTTNVNVPLASNQSEQLSWRSRSRISWAIKVLKKSMFESHSSFIRPWSVIVPSKSSEPRKEQTQDRWKSCAIRLVSISSLEGGYPELSLSFSPSWSVLRTIGPHPFQCHDRTTPWHRSAILFRSHDHVAKTSRAAHCRALCCHHRITGWVGWPLQPRCDHKKGALRRYRQYQTSHPFELDFNITLCFPPASCWPTCH